MRDYRYILFHAALRRRNLPTRAPPLGNVPAEKKRIIKTKIKFNNYVYFLLMMLIPVLFATNVSCKNGLWHCDCDGSKVIWNKCWKGSFTYHNDVYVHYLKYKHTHTHTYIYIHIYIPLNEILCDKYRKKYWKESILPQKVKRLLLHLFVVNLSFLFYFPVSVILLILEPLFFMIFLLNMNVTFSFKILQLPTHVKEFIQYLNWVSSLSL